MLGPWDSDLGLLAWLATCISVFSFLYYLQHGDVMLYGDAVAHINIARRVFDSKTPGLLQLGTVWLPLPHLLMIPFLISTEMWRRGEGGSIPSLAAYVFAAIGIFRLVRRALTLNDEPDLPARAAAWVAALSFAANPNLIYLQSTAMGEALYIALFIWSIFYFNEGLRGDAKALTKCGICLAAACLTRYDGWFLAALMVALVLIVWFRSRAAGQEPAVRTAPKITSTAVAKFILLAAAAPALWLAYNAVIYRNPLEFENGPYSAKAIEARTQNPEHPGHPGSGSLWISSLYFFKAAQENFAANEGLQRAAVLCFFIGCFAGAILYRKILLFVLLLAPVPFYAVSIAYAGVPIFVPAWWPFTHYNVRYGLQLLPAFAVSIAFVLYLCLKPPFQTDRRFTQLRWIAIAGTVVVMVASYASIWRTTPITLAEAENNMRSRNRLEAQLAGWLEKLPANCTLLMYLGDHVGALQQAAIPLSHVINEGNHHVWKHPEDPDGLWERALTNPSAFADYVVAFEGDPVWRAVHDRGLRELVDIHVTGQARAILYRAR